MKIGLRKPTVKIFILQRTSESDPIIQGELSCAGLQAIFSYFTKSYRISAIQAALSAIKSAPNLQGPVSDPCALNLKASGL